MPIAPNISDRDLCQFMSEVVPRGPDLLPPLDNHFFVLFYAHESVFLFPRHRADVLFLLRI